MREVSGTGDLAYLTADCLRTQRVSKFVPASEANRCVTASGNEVLLIWDGSNSGDVFRGVDGVVASTMVKIISDPARIDSSYLFFFLKTQFNLLNGKTTGSTIPHVSKSLFDNLAITLPPLPEQRAIAHVLRTVERAKKATEGTIAATGELKKSLLRHLFTYGPVPVQDAGKVPLQARDSLPFPEHWQINELKEVSEIVYGVQAAVANLTDPSKGIPILTNINVTNNGTLDLSTLRYYELPNTKRDALTLRPGDVLFNWRSGSKEHVGKTAIFDLAGDFTFSSFILRLRARECVRAWFLYYYLQQLKSLGYFTKNTGQSSVNSVFNASATGRVPIAVPPLREQDQTVDTLRAVDKKLRAEVSRAEALADTFNTLLTYLVTGRLRIDPGGMEALCGSLDGPCGT